MQVHARVCRRDARGHGEAPSLMAFWVDRMTAYDGGQRLPEECHTCCIYYFSTMDMIVAVSYTYCSIVTDDLGHHGSEMQIASHVVD